MNYLGLDVGTTAVKGQLFSETGEVLLYEIYEYEFKEISGERYIDIEKIWENVKKIISAVAAKYTVDALAVSSFGEAFTALDKNNNIISYPMLYTDVRGAKEAEEVSLRLSDKNIFEITGTTPNAMYSLYKLLWLKNNKKEIYDKIDKILLVGDYINYKLCGKRFIDYGLAARTGIFDIKNKKISNDLLQTFGINENWFSFPVPSGTVIGEITPEIRKELGIKNCCKVVAGSHDQICSALGAGVTEAGNCVDGMGTVECITAVFPHKITDFKMGKEGYTCVPYASGNNYCSYLLNYTCGAVVNWYRKKLLGDFVPEGENFFSYHEKEMSEEPTGILVLPYFDGAATPFQNPEAKGAVLNLKVTTSPSDLYKAIMEGTSYEMRLNAEELKSFGGEIKELIATGGGSNSIKWMQIKSNIMNIPIKPLKSSEAGVCGAAMLCAVATEKYKNLSEAKKIFVKYGETIYPNEKQILLYDEWYKKYKKIYKNIKELF